MQQRTLYNSDKHAKGVNNNEGNLRALFLKFIFRAVCVPESEMRLKFQIKLLEIA